VITFLVVWAILGTIGAIAAFAWNSDNYPTKPVPMPRRLAISGGVLLWPISFGFMVVLSIAAAVWYAPIAAMHLWRSVRKAALAEVEELEKP